VDLAKRVVTDFHSGPDAEQAAAAFDARFSRGELSLGDLVEVRVSFAEPAIALSRVIVEAGLATSGSEASRKIQQGGVKLNRAKVSDARHRVPGDAFPIVVEVGRRAVRVTRG
jgi:tyrosyl-tRNA synthetase